MDNSIQKNIKFIAVYARVSTSNQEDQKTIEAQLSEVQEYVKEHGYEVVKMYIDESWSGDILNRPELDQLRVDAKKKIWDAVLIYDPDRLSRKLFYQQIVIEELERLEIQILFVTMPPIKNSTDELMFGIRGLFASYEKAKIAERFRIGKVNRVKNNQVLTSEAPYGYTYIPNKGKRGSSDYVSGHYEINEEEAEVIKKIFHWVADDGLTVRGVVRELQKAGIKPRKSLRGVWSTSTLSTLLRHEVFIGTTYWGASYAVIPENPLKFKKYRKIEKTSRKMKPKTEWYPISVPAIIEDKDLFIRAGLRLKKNFETLGRNKVNEYLLAGMIWCVCGGRRAGEGVQKGKHLYYRCTNRVHTFPFPPTCMEAGINARITDEAVWKRIKEMMSSPELLLGQIKRWKNNRGNNMSREIIFDKDFARREIVKLQAQEDRLAKAYSQELISLEKFEEYVKPSREKIRMFEDQINKANLQKTPENNIVLPDQDEIKMFAKEVSKKLENLNFKTKQAIIRQVIDKVLAGTNDLQVYGLINLNEICSYFYQNSDYLNYRANNINKNYVVFRSEYRNCRSAKRWEINAF